MRVYMKVFLSSLVVLLLLLSGCSDTREMAPGPMEDNNREMVISLQFDRVEIPVS